MRENARFLPVARAQPPARTLRTHDTTHTRDNRQSERQVGSAATACHVELNCQRYSGVTALHSSRPAQRMNDVGWCGTDENWTTDRAWSSERCERASFQVRRLCTCTCTQRH